MKKSYGIESKTQILDRKIKEAIDRVHEEYGKEVFNLEIDTNIKTGRITLRIKE